MKQSIPRIRRVRIKGGATVEVIRPNRRNLLADIDHDLGLIKEHWKPEDVRGYAIVVWGDGDGLNNSTSCFWDQDPHRVAIHTTAVPAFVHDAIQRRLIIDRTKDELFPSSPPDDSA